MPARRATAGGADPHPAPDTADLWREFKKSGSAGARERLIVHYSPLVKYVASRVATRLPLYPR